MSLCTFQCISVFHSYVLCFFMFILLLLIFTVASMMSSPSWIMMPKCKNAIFWKTKQFIVSCNWAFQRTHYWIPKIQDGWDLPSLKSTWRNFFCWGWSDLDKILETSAAWHVDCGDVVKIETRCRIPIWQTFGRMQRNVSIEPRTTLQGAATWWIHCHDSRGTCHIAGCSHLAKSMSWSCP